MNCGDKVKVKSTGQIGKVTDISFNRVYVDINGSEVKFMKWELEVI